MRSNGKFGAGRRNEKRGMKIHDAFLNSNANNLAIKGRADSFESLTA